MGAEETNGDGFGVGWYGEGNQAGVYRSVEPAWNDWNLKNMAAHIRSGARLRAHPRVERHAGAADELPPVLPRPLALHAQRRRARLREGEARPRPAGRSVALSASILGSADSEVLFFLALTYGLEDDPPEAIARTIGLVEHVGRKHGVEFPFQGTIATTDGERIWAFRYSSEGKSRTLYFSSKDRDAARALPGDGGAPGARRREPDRGRRSRSARSPASGTRCPSRAGASSSPARTSCTRSSRSRRRSNA